ncbi:hypothetical protein L1D14_25605 [Vibrio tubiashii]|uniref:hypothetical protein n=1 Tax=Vibrio tubiashii TaxID=29498 RepID=UPI001EFDAFF4|nr:hypothetical protein [Vibrio tubiashii]MCG9579588.1 hypothetical protein [Vibrio tubiashii]
MSDITVVENDLHVTIRQQLLDSAVVESLLKEELPDYASRLKRNQCSLGDLLEVQKFIDLNGNILRNNVYIGLRLAGGLSAFSKSSGLAIRDVERLLDESEFESLIPPLCKLLNKDSAWFKTGRVFYTERQMVVIRSNNISKLVTCIEDYPSFIDALKNELSPIQHHYTMMVSGKHSPHAAKICRILERLLGLSNGVLDLSQSKFEKMLSQL